MIKTTRSIATACLLALLGGILAAAEPEFADVFVSKQEGYANYRIPSLVVTKKGTVLALCEGRTKNDDHAENDLVLKRSTDGGRTWSPLQLVRDEGARTCNDPVMTLPDTGRVLLFFVRFPSDAHTKEVVVGFEGKVTQHFVMTSDDEGKTWSPPRDVTRQVKPADARATSQGAGVGVQLQQGPHKGRVLVPMWQRIGEKTETMAYVAISDDRGETWHHSQPVPHGRDGGRPWHNISEPALAELNDGRIMMNGRGANGPIPFHRKLSHSADAGETWSQCIEEKQLPESQCQASLLRISDPRDPKKMPLMFCNPNSHEGRKNGTIRISYDEGKTWPVSKQLVAGTFRYSSLAVLPDKTIPCLFEQGASKTPSVTLARFTLDWLTDGKDKLP